MKPLNIFYAEPDADRWFKYDRYPRRLIRRIFRGPQRPGGVMMVAINLMKGLDRLNIPYRFNDYRYINKHPEELACIIGKPQVLFNREWKNPVLFGAGVFSHPIDHAKLFEQYPNLVKILVAGEWMRDMFEPYYGDKVQAWPVGIDTLHWAPQAIEKTHDFLIYDKTRWINEGLPQPFIEPLLQTLNKRGLSYRIIRYGSYNSDELKQKLHTSKAAIFLCEHETQGLAYQQMLATNTPVLAWDKGGYWLDPEYYPHRVQYSPVSSTSYWDARCGLKFSGHDDFEATLDTFMQNLHNYTPRDFILDDLTLEKCALKYVDIVKSISE
ncbi:glycosyltransferase [Mucilaginibacter gynuensis]|uniref:Glycosyltransferase n=1 Tax=Mucilaginibacter gynuensis TaxID=1302236 RepID=A0ABP8GQH9_9SPHI